MISYEDFTKLELKVGKILEAQDHPNADRLYVLKIDLADKVVQLVAGIKKSYTKEELIGKQVLVLVNLEPKDLRGVESCGMVLAAQSKDAVRVLVPDKEVDLGSIVK